MFKMYLVNSFAYLLLSKNSLTVTKFGNSFLLLENSLRILKSDIHVNASLAVIFKKDILN